MPKGWRGDIALDQCSTISAATIGRTGSAAFQAILALLRERTGTDFARYRLPTVTRRVLNRMISVGARTYDEYLAMLRVDEREPQRLLQRITIKVSRFYRNQSTFDTLRSTVLPELAARRTGALLQIWSAGCGCGEEPYTLAMLCEEAGIPASITATDIDTVALETASSARYSPSALAELPVDLRDRFCERVGNDYTVGASLRDRVRFSRHDLLTNEPPPGDGRFDLICCRNVLIYFARAPQHEAMQRLWTRLTPGGYLCLGEAEWPLPSLAAPLSPLPLRTRLFRLADSSTTRSL